MWKNTIQPDQATNDETI